MRLYQMWWEQFVRQSLLCLPYMDEYWPEVWEYGRLAEKDPQGAGAELENSLTSAGTGSKTLR